MWIGHAHAAGFGFHPWHGAEGHGGLGLSETFHQLDAGKLAELVVNGGIECLAGGAAIAQRTEVVLGEVFPDEETIDGGRCAERGDAVFLHLPQHVVGIEFLMIIDKHGGAGKPLTVELAPHCFSPAGVGYGEVDAVF